MRALPSPLRKQLETSVLAARRAAEAASRAAIESLGVFADRRPEHLDSPQAALRNGLRAKWRQMGNGRDLLIAECAYEQWHRLLFARFLAENGLLLHPQFRAPVTLADCEELATDLGEPDAWSVAARFAAEILPGIFRLDDPCVRLRLAPEGRHALEQILDAIPAETFAADDALGWVYQFWQKDKKDEVNASGRKIGGADLGPVTQLFTENYMVRFLLENSLGAWWAARHPVSPLVKGFDYLRFDDGGNPAADAFEGWPDRVAQVTVMDPCCGSGHFLVEAFSMLWQMRAEEEGLAPVEAQDAVLRDNLFGLELDPRCVQIAMFNVALQAWKAGGGWRQLPLPNIACSGIPVKASVEEWKALAGGDERLRNALVRLHMLFKDADTLGSLIVPRLAAALNPTIRQMSLEDVNWDDVAPLLHAAVQGESGDPATAVLGADAVGVARAAEYLSRQYTLAITNPPFLSRGRQHTILREYLDQRLEPAKTDLAAALWLRVVAGLAAACAVVLPDKILYLAVYSRLRRVLLSSHDWLLVVGLGTRAFSTPMYDLGVMLLITANGRSGHGLGVIDVSDVGDWVQKARLLENVRVSQQDQNDVALRPDAAIALRASDQLGRPLAEVADSWQGLVTGDVARFTIKFWEVPNRGSIWEPYVTAPREVSHYSGRDTWLRWEQGAGALLTFPGAHNFNPSTALGRAGVLLAQMGRLYATLYCGEMFNDKSVPIVPVNPEHLPALWAFCSSQQFHDRVRQINTAVSVGNGYFLKVPFDLDHWRNIAAERYPDGLPEPWSDDPTQWLFDGRPEMSTAPLQVAVGRLVGYRWPQQHESDDLDVFADADGIVCLPAVAGEPSAVDRLQQLLAAAFRESWSPAKVKELLEQTGSKKTNLADWMRDEFFKRHCSLFENRPFAWHIWDGQRDGFSALVNYHRLDRKTLEKLTYTYLGQDWVERQRAEVRDGVAGAEARLGAALDLQKRLEAILEGEAPLDIWARWKELHEQPIGWEPDLNDGVRLNIRPFVEAGVLRSPFNIHWRKDRGTNPDGTERLNDVHLTLAEKIEARKRVDRA